MTTKRKNWMVCVLAAVFLAASFLMCVFLPKGEYSAAEGTEFSSATFKADVLKYDGTVEERELGVFKYAVKGDFAEAILQSVSDGYILYSEPIKIQIEKAEKPVDPPRQRFGRSLFFVGERFGKLRSFGGSAGRLQQQRGRNVCSVGFIGRCVGDSQKKKINGEKSVRTALRITGRRL